MLGASRTAWQSRNARVYPPGGVQFQRSATEYLKGSSLGNLPTNNRVWVFSTWFKFDSLPSSTGEQLFGVGVYDADQDNNAPFFVSVTSSNLLRMYGQYGTGFVDINNITPAAPFVVGTWNHVVCKMNISGSGRTQMWHNGTRVYDAAASNSGNDFDYNDYMEYYASYSSLGFDGCMTQMFWAAQDIDLDANITKFYSNGYVNMGTSGTASGLSQPQIFHTGTTSADFDNVGGTITATITVNGTLSNCS